MLEGPFNQFLSKELAKAKNPEKYLSERLKELHDRTLELNRAREKMSKGFAQVLEGLADAYPDIKLDDPNLIDTPNRVARALLEVCSGLGIANKDAITTSFPSEKYNEVIILRNIDFSSLCSHHFFPFTGVAHIGYLPDVSVEGKVVGLSKLARIVDAHARRPQLQERLCYNVMDALKQQLKPAGVMVVMEASHGCLSCRGAMKQNARMVTSALDGKFRTDSKLRKEFLTLISGTRNPQ
jgi:GTP cyclohydrolase I